MQSYDLIVVGGGLVGAGLAVSLKQLPLRIALVDARLPSNTDPRLFGLTASSIQFLKNIGVWPTLLPHATPIHQVHVSNKGRFGAVRLHHKETGLPFLGYTVPAFEIETVLNDALSTCQNVTLFRPATLKTLSQSPDEVILALATASGEQLISAPMVIGADGTHSTVRTQTGIATKVTDYEQIAIVTRTLLQRSHHHIAYERFNSSGAIAMLPLANNECATIWTTSRDHAASLMALREEDFLKALQDEFGYRLGKLNRIAKRFEFPLSMVKADTPVLGRVLLVGNAAHTLHPIAAQGFNLAIYEVALLAECIMKQIRNNKPLNAKILAEVNTNTLSQQTISVGASSWLAQLFTAKSALISCLLQLGMTGLDIATPIKRHFLKRILGRNSRAPDLLISTL